MSTGNQLTTMTAEIVETPEFHKLSGEWTLWVHLPHNSDWSIKSYDKISTFDTVEVAIAITKTVPEIMTTNCMLFLMRKGVAPMWEDPKNRNGGCFAYKVMNKSVYSLWRDLSFCLVGNTLSTNTELLSSITGITVSPKRGFCIFKIWMTSCKFQNPSIVTADIKNLVPQGCIFKKHGAN